MIRIRIATAFLAFCLAILPVRAQQFMELPPGTLMGNVTTHTNPGSAVTLPQLIAALQKTGLPLTTISNVGGLGTGVANFLATPSGANFLAALTSKTGTGVPVFNLAPNIIGPTGIVKGDVGLGNVANVDTSNASNITSGTLPNAQLNPTGAPAQIGAISTVKVQTFCPSGCTTTVAGGGSGTYTPCTGNRFSIMEGVGGGAAGGSITGPGANSAEGSPGGGAGAYSRSLASASAIGASQSVSIGAAGAAGAAGNNAGGNGGQTSVGALLTAPGGTGGGFGGLTAGGLGGVPGTGNIIHAPGMNGEAGKWFHTAAVNPFSGAGASGPFGTGGAPSVGNGSTVAGAAGTGFGAGGSGAGSQGVATTGAGGAGLAGYVAITEFCNQ